MRNRIAIASTMALAAVLCGARANAATELAWDAEPNDRIQQAVLLRVPQGKDAVRIVGALEGEDQDAWYWSIDEEDAGVRWNLRLEGRAGAITRLDIIDLTEAMEGAGYAGLPNLTLEAKPPKLGTLSTRDGTRPAMYEDLLLRPGNYVLGISHSGGKGSYTLEISRSGSDRLRLTPDDNAAESPLATRNGRVSAVLTQDETFYGFSLSEGEADNQWAISVHTPLGVPTDAVIQDGAGEEILRIQGDGGVPIRRSGLQLAAGDYRIITHSKQLAAQRILVSPGGVATEGREVEPNDDEAQATEIEPGQELSGELGGADRRDRLRLRVSEASAGTVWNLHLRSAEPGIENIELCLQATRTNWQCRRAGSGAVSLHSLGLAPGDYQLSLDPRGGQGEWRLAWESVGPAEPGTEIEPNDKAASAVAWPDRPIAKGHFHNGQETDFWRFTVSGEPQLWRAQLQGENIHELAVHDSAGGDMQRIRASGAKRVRLDNLFLMPGEYFLSAIGTDSDYRLLLRPLGPPDPDAEREPNDAYNHALPLAFGQRRHGVLPEPRDQDLYQFSLAGPEHVRLHVEPPADGSISITLLVGDDPQEINGIKAGSETGRKVARDVYLPAGDYTVRLRPDVTSVAEYHVALERLPLFDGIVDREMNNDLDHASPVPPNGRIEGAVGQSVRKADWLRLPDVVAPTPIAIAGIPAVRFFLYADRNIGNDLLTHDRGNNRYTATLEPGTDYALKITGKGSYAFGLFDPPAGPAPTAADVAGSTSLPATSLRATSPAGASPPAASPLSARIVFDDTPAVQSFSPWRQTLAGRLVLTNASGSRQKANVETVLSDDRWRIEMDAGAWTLDPGSPVERTFTLGVPPDALSGRSVRVNVRVTDEAGRETYAMAEVATAPDILPRNPHHGWSVPPELRGGLNVAAAALGGRIVASPGIEQDDLGYLEPLIDGLTEYGRWTGTRLSMAGRSREEYPRPTVALAGGGPVPVAGFVLNPTSSITADELLREFAVALSQDGEQFEVVLRGTLRSTPMDQAFPLAEPVLARYARLVPLSIAHGPALRNPARLGEFKVVARPGFVPDHLIRVNLAAPEVGGHLVWADPWIRGSGFDTSLLGKDEKAQRLKTAGGQPATVVLGFHHARAARITSVSIDKLAAAKPETDVGRVGIFRSDTTPLGPYEPIGEWALDAAETTIEFEQPVWARYLQFRFHGKEGARQITLPDRIAVWEAPVTDDYRSILAEWGHYGSDGPLEAAREPRYAGPAERPDNDSRGAALVLAAGASAPGLALLDEYESWYRLDVPAGMNTVALAMRGSPTLQARPELLDAAGASVPLYEEEGTPGEMRWQAFVEPGGSYWLRAFEPPRALIISWDTSASVGWYLPSMINALYRYAEDIRPERDVVNLLPFGQGRPLLQNWQGEPYPLKRILGSYAHDTNSSAAERALAIASDALAERPPGKRAVILLTDAATSTDAGLWPALRETRPTVFALGVSSEGALSRNPRIEQDLMQDWSRVNGGVYQYITSLGALQQGYERAISRMRQPVAFEVAVDFAFTEDPGPARLRLVSGDTALDPHARGAVELILDASGSMLKRMGGERRIEIAKTAIADVVQNVLPAGMPLALRVYGHREAGSCRTDLEQPLAPLDKAALLAKLEAVNAVNLAKTPIADSLAKVASDLSDASGRRWVILLTDGEETCDGDPAAVLEKLAADGIDVRLNIVGFAIDDEALKEEFARWAELGNGAYFDAAEAEALKQAMAQALQIPYYVKDSNGETVAEGVLDGEAVELPAGRYLVELDTQPPRRFRDVVLAPGDALELDIGNE